MENTLKRCWNTNNPLYIEYHDKEWGVPLHDEILFFEFLALSGFQAGLSWLLILQKRTILRKAFDFFNPVKIAQYSSEEIDRIIKTKGIIKNRVKIAVTINNARCFLGIQKEIGSFDRFIWSFVDNKVINNSYSRLEDIPVTSQEALSLSRELKKEVSSL